ncbi:MAG: endonuclease/exonuclease/phosphatase family protein [Bdellovibrionota bacterium]
MPIIAPNHERKHHDQQDRACYRRGYALLYRFDLESAEEHDLSYRKFEPRGALAATLKIDGERSVRVVNTHLGLKYWERVYQIKKILSDLTWRNDGLTILAGDFNEWLGITPNSYRLSSAFPPCKKMLTFPSRWPRFALDRIFISGNVQSYEHFVADFRDARLASDHLPVVADLLTT